MPLLPAAQEIKDHTGPQYLDYMVAEAAVVLQAYKVTEAMDPHQVLLQQAQQAVQVAVVELLVTLHLLAVEVAVVVFLLAQQVQEG
jgi:hypothetical protein